MTAKYEVQLEEAFRKASPQLESFVRRLRIIRWKPWRGQRNRRIQPVASLHRNRELKLRPSRPSGKRLGKPGATRR